MHACLHCPAPGQILGMQLTVGVDYLRQRTSSTAANVAFLASSIRSFLSSSSVSVAAPTYMALSTVKEPSHALAYGCYTDAFGH